MAGHLGDEAAARALLGDPSPAVRATALGALARLACLRAEDISAALSDIDPGLRRRACELAVAVDVDLLPVLADDDPRVAEAAAWALGERADTSERVIAALSETATGHEDALCRESAVAALGALGDEGGLAAILAATSDRPAVRRRAVLALAPFDGPDVAAALARALEDRDWQVRQAAQDLLAE